MKILIDMNLSPNWVGVLEQDGIHALHWSSVGKRNATDREIFGWARENSYIVFTHDLDFGSLLASTNAAGPSVIQIRSQDVHPKSLGSHLIHLLRRFESQLENGALVTVDRERSRARILPLG